MTKRNRPTASRHPSATPPDSSDRAFDRRFEPRPFRRHPWLLAIAAAAMAGWMTFLLLMAWQPWAPKKRPPPLREKEAAKAATADN